MAKIPRAEVAQNVLKIISSFTNLKPALIKESQVLTKPPLLFDSTRLTFLALSLRGYVKLHNNSQTVLATEVKKSGLTVEGLIDLVHKKINTTNA